MELHDTKAHTLFKDLSICSLPLSLCRGQAFDEWKWGIKYEGVKNGIQALEENRLLHVHCLAHNPHGVLQNEIKFPPKRLPLFDSYRNQVALGRKAYPPTLTNLCPT